MSQVVREGAEKRRPLTLDPAPARATDGSTNPRSQRARITRERIVQAAAGAFDKRGYLGVNLKDVVDEIDLTKGALYYFFPTKEDLAVEIVNRHAAAWGPITQEVVGAFDNKLDALVEITYRVAQKIQTDPIARAGTRLSIESNLIQAELPRPFEDWIDGLTRLLELAKSLGQISAEIDPGATAEVVVAFFYGAQTVSRGFTEQPDLVARLDRFWGLFLPSLRLVRRTTGPEA